MIDDFDTETSNGAGTGAGADAGARPRAPPGAAGAAQEESRTGVADQETRRKSAQPRKGSPTSMLLVWFCSLFDWTSSTKKYPPTTLNGTSSGRCTYESLSICRSSIIYECSPLLASISGRKQTPMTDSHSWKTGAPR